MKKKKLYVVGCLPKKAFPEPPPDVESPEITTCGYCGEEMWIGKLKRKFLSELKLKKEPVFFGCIPCAVKRHFAGMTDEEFEANHIRLDGRH